MKVFQKVLALYLSFWLLFASGAINAAQTDQSVGESAPPVVKQAPEELQQLVAPIALYPDALVSQILAGATYPTEIVEADRWVQDHSDLKGKDLADAVDQQSWDPSTKALTQFPSVLANMDKNLSWTSALGEAYVNQSADVMDAVQVMRARAQAAGNLKSNEQEKVVTEEKTIVIEPADPEVVYVPAYDPWIVYGAPVVVWPGWYADPGLYIAAREFLSVWASESDCSLVSVGVAWVGMRLGPPNCHLQPPHIHFRQQDVPWRPWRASRIPRLWSCARI